MKRVWHVDYHRDGADSANSTRTRPIVDELAPQPEKRARIKSPTPWCALLAQFAGRSSEPEAGVRSPPDSRDHDFSCSIETQVTATGARSRATVGIRFGGLIARWPAALFAALLAGMGPVPAWAGPPFLTDDPAPVDFRHYETYVFT